MLDEKIIISLSQRLTKKNILSEKEQLNGVFPFIKKKKENNSETYNRSIDFFEKTTTLFNKLEKLKEPKFNNKNIIRNTGKNSDKNTNKKPFKQLLENNNNKRIFSKKNLLDQILQNKQGLLVKDKAKSNSLNSKAIKLSKILNKSSLLINDSTANDNNFDANKINFFKIKNEYVEGGKTGNYNNKTFIQEKLEQINMNKTALFKKIKFESLKKFCKNVKLTDKKIGINLIVRKGENNKNEVRKNNCEEIKISCIKEKVRNYFIGRFNNIKEYFDSWDEQKSGRININDIYNYLNKKIKYKISKSDTRKLLFSFSNRNYLDLENFRIIFFENSPKEKLFIRGNKIFEYHEALTKNLSEISHINRSENNCNISFFEKFRFNEMISLLLNRKNLILSQINRDRVELTFIEFYSIIRNFIKEKKFNFDKEIKRLFNDYKEKNSDLINIYNFFEKLNEKKEDNKKNHPIINIKKHINQGLKPFYNKNKSSFFVLNSRNSKTNNFAYKDTNQSKTNFISDKVMNREVENDKKINIGNISNLNKFKNMNINYIRERRNSFNSKYFMSNIKNDKSYNNFDINDKNRITNENIENSKIIDFQLPNINNHERNRNKNRNSDIIDFL
jgi:hypothetical protein